MTTTQVVETSLTVDNNSLIQDYVHPDDQTQPTYESYYCEFWRNVRGQPPTPSPYRYNGLETVKSFNLFAVWKSLGMN